MGGKTTSTTNTNSPNPQVLQDYQSLLGQAQKVASTPYQPYGGQLVAGLNAGQNSAIGQLQGASTAANGYLNSGTGYLNNAESGLNAVQPWLQQAAQTAGQNGMQPWLNSAAQSSGFASDWMKQAGQAVAPGAAQQYMNPYLQSAVAATQANLNENDAQQQQQVVGNAIQSGAWGGDRSAVAQSELARQQGLANGQTISGMENQGYQQAQQQANAAAGVYGGIGQQQQAQAGLFGQLGQMAGQQQLAQAGLYGQLGQMQGQTAQAQGQLAGLSGYLGQAAEQTGVQGASAALQGATLAQQNQQAQLAAAYQQYQLGQSYPFQTTGWLGNLVEGIGNQSGGSSVTTSPGPSTLSQITGAATTGLGILGATGAFGSSGYLTGRKDGGAVRAGFDIGGDVDPNAGLAPPAAGISFSNPNFSPSAGIAGGPNVAVRNTAGSVPAVRMPGLGVTSGAPAAVPAAAPPASAGLGGLSPNSTTAAAPGDGNKNLWMGVMSAGLGMLGGSSPFAGVNIGRGAQEGLQTYNTLNQQDRTYGLDSRKVDLESQRLANEAKFQQGQIANQTAQVGAQVANSQSEIEARKQQMQQSRYERTFIPGMGPIVYDKNNPFAPPQFAPMPQMPGAPAPVPADLSAGSAAGAAPGLAPPMGDPGAQPPATGLAAPSGPGSGPPPSMPGPAGSPSPGLSPPVGPAPQASAPTSTAPNVMNWQPTTAVPKGYLPANQMQIYTAPGQLQFQQELAKKPLEEARAGAAAADQTLFRLDEMNQEIGNLPKTGFLAPGAYATERQNIAKGINAFVGAFGGQPVLDPSQVASNEGAIKDRFRLGADLSRQIGGREPGFIVQQAVTANPGIDNTAMGYKRIVAGLQQAAEYQRVRASFFNDYAAKFGHLDGAQELFDQKNPPQMYAQRAIVSTVDPRDLQALTQNAGNPAAAQAIDQKYGNGTSSLILGGRPKPAPAILPGQVITGTQPVSQ